MMRVRISIHGAVYTAVGLLLLAGGLLRGELLSAACGGLLAVYALFAAVALGITAVCWKDEEPETVAEGGCFTVSPEGAAILKGSSNLEGAGIPDDSGEPKTTARRDVSAGRKTVLSARSSAFVDGKTAQAGTAFPFCAAGVAVFYTIEFSAVPDPAAKTVATVSVPLQKRRTVYAADTLPRGRYFYKRRYLCLRDFAGFFSILFMQGAQSSRSYVVLPPVLPLEDRPLPELRSRVMHDAPSQERTAELYESRPYFPGDDPRKIHWKLYAHTHALSVKLGAFEPPPVKHLTIYIEEPHIMKKKDRMFLAPVFDAFTGRLSSLIVQLQKAGIQCCILLNDYAETTVREHPGAAAKTDAAKTNESVRKSLKSEQRDLFRKSLRRYDIQADLPDAFMQVRKLLAVPALCSAPEDLPDAASVFKAMPEGGGLLYCYVPAADGAGIEAKIRASRRSGVQTVFYAALPPSKQTENTVKQRFIKLIHTSAATARKEAFYRTMREAAERDLRIFAAGNCHAELL